MDAQSWPNGYEYWPDLTVKQGEFDVRPLAWDDRNFIRQWRNSQLEILRQRTQISIEQQDDYFNVVIAPQMHTRLPSQVLLAIELAGRLVGYGGLTNIEWNDRHAELSFLVDPQFLTNPPYDNILSAFVAVISEIARSQFGMHRIFTETYSYRKSHLECLEASHFKREGVLKEHSLIDGNYVDSIIHGLILD